MTKDELNRLIVENNIISRTDFENRFPSAYLRFLKLNKEDRDSLLPSLVNDYSYLESKEDYIKFIQENNILDRIDFRKRFLGEYRRFNNMFSYEDSESIIPHVVRKINNYPILKDKKDFSTFFISNNITSRTDLQKRFSGAYNKFLNLTEDEQDDLLPLKNNNYKYLKTEEDWNKFIKENKITNKTQLKKFSGSVSQFKKLSEELQNKILPSKINRLNIKGKDNIRLFIKTEGIKTRGELHDLYPGIYKNFRKLSKEDQNKLLPSLRNYYPDLVDKNSLSEFIQENKIISRYDFYCRFPGACSRFNKILTEEEKDEILPIVDKHKSSGELYLMNLFVENEINFELEKSFDGLKDSISLRYDFYLPDYNTLVEYHGGQHFDTTCYFCTEDSKKHDKMKYDYAINNRITILYFTREKDVYKRFGYFTEVITDPNILINKIKRLA